MNATQRKHILKRLNATIVSRYELRARFIDERTPKMPKCVKTWLEKKELAEKQAGKEATAIYNEQREFLQKIEDELILGGEGFDLLDAIKKMQEIANGRT